VFVEGRGQGNSSFKRCLSFWKRCFFSQFFFFFFPPFFSSSLSEMTTIYWFRKALRLHDSPSLHGVLPDASSLCPIFILDPWFRKSGRVGALRYNHLLETLCALDRSLKAAGSSLILIEGTPVEVFSRILTPDVELLAFEKDSEPYAKKRDAEVLALAQKLRVATSVVSGHTLYDLDSLRERAKGKVPTTYGQFCKLAESVAPAKPLPTPQKLPPLAKLEWVQHALKASPSSEWMKRYALPLEEGQKSLIRGGEDVALLKMEVFVSNAVRVATFEKPKTDPTKAWLDCSENVPKAATTVLSPYLHFGSLSPRTFYWKLIEAEKKHKNSSKPPVSLVGQLLWREFFHMVGCFTENFDRVAGNPICRQIPWKSNEEHFEAWRRARTGFPWIDAIMTQLRTEGWIHHLARHCVACFLTRGDL
jgi:cryptochrome